MDDVLGLGKVLPVDKLLDMLSKTVGVVMKPYFDRKDIDTKAYEIQKLTEAEIGAMRMLATAVKENSYGVGGISYSEGGMTIESLKQAQEQVIQSLSVPVLEDRTRTRIDYQEAKKQLNIESVTSFTAEELQHESPVTNEPVDEGWASRFFKYAEDISSEEMQLIWGRILAGEIKQPNTYSLRTLELLRNLSQQEAEIFIKVSNLVLGIGNAFILFKYNRHSSFEEFNVSSDDLSVMKELNIIHAGEFMSYDLSENDETGRYNCLAGDKIILIDRPSKSPTKGIPAYVLTQLGGQLMNLVKTNPPNKYLNAFAKFLKDANATVKYSFIKRRTTDEVSYSAELSDFPLPEAISNRP